MKLNDKQQELFNKLLEYINSLPEPTHGIEPTTREDGSLEYKLPIGHKLPPGASDTISDYLRNIIKHKDNVDTETSGEPD